MLSNANLWHPRDFWTDIISTICYPVNQSPHSSIDFKIPEEVWLSNPVDYFILRVFGYLEPVCLSIWPTVTAFNY